jgi:hypothetical protein
MQKNKTTNKHKEMNNTIKIILKKIHKNGIKYKEIPKATVRS